MALRSLRRMVSVLLLFAVVSSTLAAPLGPAQRCRPALPATLYFACEWPQSSFFGTTTCNIGVIGGGTRPNVIPDSARAELQIRLAIDIEHVKRVLEDACGTRGRLEYASLHNPVRLFTVPGFDECVVRFTTDVPYLSQWGKPLLLGPGSILVAHTDHERISKRELESAVGLYVNLAKRLQI